MTFPTQPRSSKCRIVILVLRLRFLHVQRQVKLPTPTFLAPFATAFCLHNIILLSNIARFVLGRMRYLPHQVQLLRINRFNKDCLYLPFHTP